MLPSIPCSYGRALIADEDAMDEGTGFKPGLGRRKRCYRLPIYLPLLGYSQPPPLCVMMVPIKLSRRNTTEGYSSNSLDQCEQEAADHNESSSRGSVEFHRSSLEPSEGNGSKQGNHSYNFQPLTSALRRRVVQFLKMVKSRNACANQFGPAPYLLTPGIHQKSVDLSWFTFSVIAPLIKMNHYTVLSPTKSEISISSHSSGPRTSISWIADRIAVQDLVLHEIQLFMDYEQAPLSLGMIELFKLPDVSKVFFCKGCWLLEYTTRALSEAGLMPDAFDMCCVRLCRVLIVRDTDGRVIVVVMSASCALKVMSMRAQTLQ
ncbi:hypothetical protein Tco_0955965 [Tanacetum coccineum]|uniref:Uncharacterized protein n=1 Tax=Tanacetum coccineum TaxID=301880 RepID=A0ABQ5E8M5_9ASTR